MKSEAANGSLSVAKDWRADAKRTSADPFCFTEYSMKKASERIVLITGGSAGLGLALAAEMLKDGSKVIVCSRSNERLEKAKKAFPALTTVQCDITSASDRDALLGRITAEVPDLNMLINNAGIVERFHVLHDPDFTQAVESEWKTNYFATLEMIRLFLPLLKKNAGTIVNVGSGLAYIPLHIQPNYSATKAALHSFTLSLRWQLAGSGIDVKEILYPAVRTEFQKGRNPAFAIDAKPAARMALNGLNSGADEVRVGMVKKLYLLARLLPETALKLLNRRIEQTVRTVDFKRT